MTPERAHQLTLLSRQLTENLMSAAFSAKTIGELAQAEICDVKRPAGNGIEERRSDPRPRPLLDESTLSVLWKGRTLHLGHTHSFWLLARLARRPNQYVTHVDLLKDIWDDEFKDTTVLRSVVRRLRLKLRLGGMGDLAAAIRGHHGRYMLDLLRSGRHNNVTVMAHRMS